MLNVLPTGMFLVPLTTAPDPLLSVTNTVNTSPKLYAASALLLVKPKIESENTVNKVANPTNFFLLINYPR